MSIDCVFTSGPCSRYVCPNPCSTRRIITRRVRMPMSLFTSRRSAFSIGTQREDPFSGPSDRAVPAVNPITGSVGVDKKHNSYARYLGRLKAPVLRQNMQYGTIDPATGVPECGYNCCCYCSQKIDNGNTGMSYVPQIGDIAVQTGGAGAGATGTVIAVGATPPDIDWFTIKADDCNNLFTEGGTITIAGGSFTHQTDIYTITTVTTCSSGSAGETPR